MYAMAVNLFLTPLNLYAGGVVGLAQLIRTLAFPHVTGIDVAGLINLMLNIPLFLLAWKGMSRKMVFGTAVSIFVQTLVLSAVKAPAAPLLDDKLACILLAGMIGGAGCGIVLTNGGSAGGLDLLGVYLTMKSRHFSVGLMNILFNVGLYSVCAVLFELSTALYSAIIELELMIFTHHPEIKETIMKKYVRGVTCWKGMGAYTGKETEVLVTVVAKSEAEDVKRDILALDPHAFIIVHQGTDVTGGYQKRLV